MRVVAFCAVAALLVGLLFGVMPLEGDRLLVQRSDCLCSRRNGRRRKTSRAARHGRSRDRRPSLFWRGAPARRSSPWRVRPGIPRGKRALDAGRSAGREVPTLNRSSSFDQVEAEIKAVPASPTPPGRALVPLDFFDEGGSRSRSSAILRSTRPSGRAPNIRWSARRTSPHSICRFWRARPSMDVTDPKVSPSASSTRPSPEFSRADRRRPARGLRPASSPQSPRS